MYEFFMTTRQVDTLPGTTKKKRRRKKSEIYGISHMATLERVNFFFMANLAKKNTASASIFFTTHPTYYALLGWVRFLY